MPRTETAAAPTTEPVQQPSSAAALTSVPPLPRRQRQKHPTRDDNGALLDWKDIPVALAALYGGVIAVFSLLVDDYGVSGWSALVAAVALSIFFGRRALWGGPAPVVRRGVGWDFARVVGGVALFCFALFALLALITKEGDGLALGALSFCSLAVGATLDHLVRTPKDDDP